MFLQYVKGSFTRHGNGACAVDGIFAVKMGCMVPNETIYMLTVPTSVPWTACHAHWVLYPFFHGKNAVHGTGAVAVSCKRALRDIDFIFMHVCMKSQNYMQFKLIVAISISFLEINLYGLSKTKWYWLYILHFEWLLKLYN